MLLTISTTHAPATDLGYLLHKNPERIQDFDLSFGKAHIFYPEATEQKCTIAMLLDIDPIGLVRRQKNEFSLFQYVNDRPYVASSFMSVAISRVFGTAMSGRCKKNRNSSSKRFRLNRKYLYFRVVAVKVFYEGYSSRLDISFLLQDSFLMRNSRNGGRVHITLLN